MLFSDLELRRIKKLVGGFCDTRVADQHRRRIKIWYETRGYEVKIFESRPSFMRVEEWTRTPVARLRFDPQNLEWDLYWARSSGRWQKYAGLEPARDLKQLISEIGKDPHGVFWG